jgi:hypothetical protein
VVLGRWSAARGVAGAGRKRPATEAATKGIGGLVSSQSWCDGMGKGAGWDLGQIFVLWVLVFFFF